MRSRCGLLPLRTRHRRANARGIRGRSHPGAVRFRPRGQPGAAGDWALLTLKTELWRRRTVQRRRIAGCRSRLFAPLKLDRAILVYCGRGGLDSLPVARALRWRGWSVDHASWRMDQLPPLGAGRPGGSARMASVPRGRHVARERADRILNALAVAGHQVLNVRSADGAPAGSISFCTAQQPRRRGSSPVAATTTCRGSASTRLDPAMSRSSR